jgi:hypothetical protein
MADVNSGLDPEVDKRITDLAAFLALGLDDTLDGGLHAFLRDYRRRQEAEIVRLAAIACDVVNTAIPHLLEMHGIAFDELLPKVVFDRAKDEQGA